MQACPTPLQSSNQKQSVHLGNLNFLDLPISYALGTRVRPLGSDTVLELY